MNDAPKKNGADPSRNISEIFILEVQILENIFGIWGVSRIVWNLVSGFLLISSNQKHFPLNYWHVLLIDACCSMLNA